MVGKGYRPDIDGLRALAVLSVVFYHVGYGWFSGGYVGVDVFFVISGFLITRLIRDEIEADRFRLSTFYIRRARRLFPALFVTLAASFLAGMVLFGPGEFERLSRSVVFTVLSASNFLFWWESGYFDAAAETKPLLHTWSLSVEEQFYLLWPVTLAWLTWWSRRRAARAGVQGVPVTPAFLVIAGIASLVATEYVLRIDAAAAFYLVPFRIVELAIGALMVWLVDYRPSWPWVVEALVPAGLALIAWPVFAYTGDTVFPGLAALPPCLGTALLIYAGTARKAGRILDNQVAVGIGLVSYSLYLAHWPVIVFYRAWVLRPLEAVEQAAVVLVSIGLAAAMYRFVEQPFRRAATREGALPPGVFVRACAVLAGLLVVPAALAWESGGWAWRLPVELRAAVADLEDKREATWERVRTLEKRKRFTGDGRRILVVGDSNAKDFTNALLAAAERSGTALQVIPRFVSYHCQPFIGARTPSPALSPRRIRKCNRDMRALVSGDLVKQADVIVFSPRWTDTGVDHIAGMIRRLRKRTDTPIVLMGRTVEFDSVPALLVRHGTFEGIDEVAAHNRVDLSAINGALKAVAETTGVTYLSKDPLVCARPDRCDVVDALNRLLIYDYGHWTLDGAAFYGARMVENGYLDAIAR